MCELWVFKLLAESSEKTKNVNTFASGVRKRNFRIRPTECVFRITRKVDKISYELDYRLHQENIQFLFFLVHIYSRGASDDSHIAQSFFEKEIPAQAPCFTKVSSSSFSQAVFFNRHSLSYVTLSEAQTCFTALGHSWMHSHFSWFPLCFTQRENGEEHFLLQPKRWQCSRSF